MAGRPVLKDSCLLPNIPVLSCLMLSCPVCKHDDLSQSFFTCLKQSRKVSWLNASSCQKVFTFIVRVPDTHVFWCKPVDVAIGLIPIGSHRFLGQDIMRKYRFILNCYCKSFWDLCECFLYPFLKASSPLLVRHLQTFSEAPLVRIPICGATYRHETSWYLTPVFLCIKP